MNRNSTALLLNLTACYAVGYVGTSAILSAISFWYLVVAKPVWSAPSWILVPAWLVLHGLMGGAAWLAREAPQKNPRRTPALVVFLLWLATNEVWAWLFFRSHRLLPALVTAGFIGVFGVATTLLFWRIRPVAGRLLVPCLAWATYAIALTAAVWRLNR